LPTTKNRKILLWKVQVKVDEKAISCSKFKKTFKSAVAKHTKSDLVKKIILPDKECSMFVGSRRYLEMSLAVEVQLSGDEIEIKKAKKIVENKNFPAKIQAELRSDNQLKKTTVGEVYDIKTLDESPEAAEGKEDTAVIADDSSLWIIIIIICSLVIVIIMLTVIMISVMKMEEKDDFSMIKEMQAGEEEGPDFHTEDPQFQTTPGIELQEKRTAGFTPQGEASTEPGLGSEKKRHPETIDFNVGGHHIPGDSDEEGIPSTRN